MLIRNRNLDIAKLMTPTICIGTFLRMGLLWIDDSMEKAKKLARVGTASVWVCVVFQIEKDLGLGRCLNQDTRLNCTLVFFEKKGVCPPTYCLINRLIRKGSVGSRSIFKCCCPCFGHRMILFARAPAYSDGTYHFPLFF